MWGTLPSIGAKSGKAVLKEKQEVNHSLFQIYLNTHWETRQAGPSFGSPFRAEAPLGCFMSLRKKGYSPTGGCAEEDGAVTPLTSGDSRLFGRGSP